MDIARVFDVEDVKVWTRTESSASDFPFGTYLGRVIFGERVSIGNRILDVQIEPEDIGVETEILFADVKVVVDANGFTFSKVEPAEITPEIASIGTGKIQDISRERKAVKITVPEELINSPPPISELINLKLIDRAMKE